MTGPATPTDYWNDLCSIEELAYGIGHGTKLLEATYMRYRGNQGRLPIQTQSIHFVHEYMLPDPELRR